MSDLKTIDQVVTDIRSRMTRNWHTDLTGETTSFPHRFFLGRPTRQALEANWGTHHDAAVAWRDWANTNSIRLDWKDRDVQRTTQAVPEYAHIDTLDTAAHLVGAEWTSRLARNRERISLLNKRFPHAEPAAVLRTTDKYTDNDFDVLLTAADWFNSNPGAAEGLTPRMVPIPGVHAKWLQDHRKGLDALTGVTITDLVRHPQRIHFTYLDPDYRRTDARIHDSATTDDRFRPAYPPRIVVISENKDTAIHFPELAGGVAVEGVGRGGKTPAAFPWLRDAPAVIYWGDIDKDGYEILDGYRADFERPIHSILMDQHTYDTYERFGTDLDRRGNVIGQGTPRDTPNLTPTERAVYENLHNPTHAGHRRIEQERIPLAVALEALQALV